MSWTSSGLLAAGVGYQSSTTFDLVRYAPLTGAVQAQVAGVGKYGLGYGQIHSCCIDYAGNIIVGERIVAAQPTDFGPTGWTAGRMLSKYSSTGGRIFSIIAPGSGTFNNTERVPSGVAVDTDNSIYMAENRFPRSASPRAILRKFTPSGAQVWEKDLGEGGDAYTFGVMGVPSGGCVVAFTTNGTAEKKLARRDANGAQVWQREVAGHYMPASTGRRVISMKPSERYVAVCHGSWFTEDPTTELVSVETGATLWAKTHGTDQNHSCDIGGSGDNEAVFVMIVNNDDPVYKFIVEKRSIASGALLASRQTGSADLSPNTGYPIACTGNVVATMRHDHHEFDIPFVDRWDEYNFYTVVLNQEDLSGRWEKFWGRLSGFMDNEEGPYGELNNFGRAPG